MPDPRHEHWMTEAMCQAQSALPEDVPVGAVMVRAGEVIARACNRREKWADPTAHAEILLLREAGQTTGDWRLSDCTLYVTLEPCPMCMAAIVQARVPLVVFGAADPMLGAAGSRLMSGDIMPGQPAPQVLGGIQEAACKQMLTDFFAQRRS